MNNIVSFALLLAIIGIIAVCVLRIKNLENKLEMEMSDVHSKATKVVKVVDQPLTGAVTKYESIPLK